tara:strand:- start:40 stop:678 length:639 start_codon:yes stop_codon:yes gene_type:complete
MISDINIIEDVLPEIYVKEILDLVVSNAFPWYFEENISLYGTAAKELEKKDYYNTLDHSSGFVHLLISGEQQNSSHWNLIKPIVYFLSRKANFIRFDDTLEVSRCKINLQTQNNISTLGSYNAPHIDEPLSDWIFLYYLTDSDSSTYIFNEMFDSGKFPDKLTIRKKVKHKSNTGVLFRGSIFHSSSNPVNEKKRININFNFKIRDWGRHYG